MGVPPYFLVVSICVVLELLMVGFVRRSSGGGLPKRLEWEVGLLEDEVEEWIIQFVGIR